MSVRSLCLLLLSISVATSSYTQGHVGLLKPLPVLWVLETHIGLGSKVSQRDAEHWGGK